MSYSELANSPLLWGACGVCVVWILFQAFVFARKSLAISKEVGLTQDQIRSAVKTSIFASIGPSLAILTGMIALLVAMGGAIAWFRLSYIGSVAYEAEAAELAAQAAGSALGSDMTAVAFVSAVWVMSICSMGSPLFTALFAHKLDKIQNFFAGGKSAMLPVVSACGTCGAFAYLCMDRVLRMNIQTVAALGGFMVMAAFCIINKKADKKWIRSWGFTISMFAGMLIAAVFA